MILLILFAYIKKKQYLCTLNEIKNFELRILN